MIRNRDIELIERDIKIVGPDKQKDIENGLKIVRAWLKAPVFITRTSWKEQST